ncbi:DDE-type integrase/transposase/recombinase [Paenibacillus sp. M-152]|uniref:DDE-type integrase/transposase/recombinase n=1 Tax=Paenibacillus sp. M-152 TaxID=2487928 RepID=UPI000F7014B4|nr:DDE-type integrase/transposase/recombinase [Paenibacillus sp. M-152]AZH31398.1 transposase [Paenibacillus sp. M-152]
MEYGWIAGERQFSFLMIIIDVFDRAVVTYQLGLSCKAKDLVQITQEVLMKRRLLDNTLRPVLRSDNGPQFISHRLADACEHFKMIHERIPSKTSNKNAHIESFHAILECCQRYEFESYQQVYEVVTAFIHN